MWKKKVYANVVHCLIKLKCLSVSWKVSCCLRWLKLHQNVIFPLTSFWGVSQTVCITSCWGLKDCLSLMAEQHPDSLISYPAHFVSWSSLFTVLSDVTTEVLGSYLFLPHCPLITSLPSSQSFLICLSKSPKRISIFHTF